MLLSLIRTVQKRAFVSFPSSLNPIHTYRLSRRVAIQKSVIFDVVSDVTNYKTFIPFVNDSFVQNIDPTTKLPNKAGFSIGWHDYDEHMVCDVDCRKDERVFSRVRSSLVFDHLENEWTFTSVNPDCGQLPITQVNLHLQYRFKNPLLNSLSSIFQSQVSQIMIDSFLKQAITMQEKARRS